MKPDTTPKEVIDICRRLGERIRAARLRRKLRHEDLLLLTGYARSTLRKIENGDHNVAIAKYFYVLWVMGLTNEIELVADPGIDRDGLSISLDAMEKRVYVPRKVNDEF